MIPGVDDGSRSSAREEPRARPSALLIGLLAVTIAAGAIVLFTDIDRNGRSTLPLLDWTTWVFAAGAAVCEIFPVRLRRRNGDVETITVATPLVFAILLTSGPTAAAVTYVGAALLSGMVHPRPWYGSLYDAANYALSTYAAWVVLHLAGVPLLQAEPYPRLPAGVEATPFFAAWMLGPLALAGIAFFALNTLLTVAAIGLRDRAPLVTMLTPGELAFPAATETVLIGAGAVLAQLTTGSPILLPLMALPLLAVQQNLRLAGRLEHEALHDALTGLPNRSLLRLEVVAALAESRPLALLHVDLNRFREINDTLGHRQGDRVLREVAARLEALVEGTEGALVARLGGDEFALLLPGVLDPSAAEALADAVRGALARPVEIEDMRISSQASVGVVLAPAHGEDAESLLARADISLFQAKTRSRGVTIYDPASDQGSRRRLALAGDLRDAVESGSLTLHFQPQAELRTGAITGVEALARWTHPEYGAVPPDEFIPLAERTGLIDVLTRAVLREALRSVVGWGRIGRQVRVSVNVSARTLADPDFPQVVADLLTREGASPAQLILEVTESTVMEDPERAIAALQAFQLLGIESSIDDFGTGHSSLAYLSSLPVAEVKIDKSFVLRLTQGSPEEAIVSATVDVARRLGLRVVAEGVESAEAWSLLARIGCDHAQGYLLSRPVERLEFTRWLMDHPRVAPALMSLGEAARQEERR